MVYLGPLDFLVVDQGSGNTLLVMREAAEAAGVKLDEAPLESPGSIGMVKRYRAPLKHAYRRTSDQECLDLTVFAIDCTVGPELLYIILLMYRAVF